MRYYTYLVVGKLQNTSHLFLLFVHPVIPHTSLPLPATPLTLSPNIITAHLKNI